MKKYLIGLLGLTFALAVTASAKARLPDPMPNTYVHDFAGVIPKNKLDEINAKAGQLKDLYNAEIALVTVDSLHGEDQFDYSLALARSWGIGSPDNEIRGLLILVAVEDRKTSFRTSRHIEGELPDAVTGDVSRAMNVYFKKGDFGNGLSTGMSLILDRMREVHQPPAPTQPQPADGGNQSGSGLLGDLFTGLIEFLFFGGIIWFIRVVIKDQIEARRWKSKPGTSYYSPSTYTPSSSGDDDSNSSSWWSSGSDSSGSSSGGDSGSSSRSDSSSSSGSSGSSSGGDSGYSGGSDFGGGGSDSSW